MELKCLLGHNWNGCKCSRCGKVRDEQHDWDLCKGKCKRCSKTQEELHDWNVCICKRCEKKIADDSKHKWKGCKCLICGKTREEQHDWSGCVCNICGKNRDKHHDWCGCICRKCGKRQYSSKNHKWIEIEPGPMGVMKRVCRKKCERCGETEINCVLDGNAECTKCGAYFSAFHLP